MSRPIPLPTAANGLSRMPAVARGLELAAEGAEVVDIGGESTRPGAQPVAEAEELRRVVPVIERLAEEIQTQWRMGTRVARPSESGGRRGSAALPVLSIDTMKPAVARAALKAGASVVNDVAANRASDGVADEMWRVVAEFGAGYVAMHAPGASPAMPAQPVYRDVVREVGDFFRERLERLKAYGVAAEQVVFDPGIGFGKTLEQNMELLAHLHRLARWSRPLLLGVSRKSFIQKLLGAEVNARLPASLACATLAVAAGVQMIRTHDVAETVQAVRMAEALLAVKRDDARTD